jgi:hypothetical protein
MKIAMSFCAPWLMKRRWTMGPHIAGMFAPSLPEKENYDGTCSPNLLHQLQRLVGRMIMSRHPRHT